MSYDLSNKMIDINQLANIAIEDSSFLKKLIGNLTIKDDNIRSNSFEIVHLISIEKPKILYPFWEQFIPLLESKNRYHQYIAIYLISNLTIVDDQEKFEKIFDKYFKILSQSSTMSAAHCIKKSSTIVKVKPHLEKKITELLLSIEKIHPGKQIELIKSSVIEAFQDYFEESSNKNDIIKFVEKQCSSTSPSTRKNAKEFLNKFEKY